MNKLLVALLFVLAACSTPKEQTNKLTEISFPEAAKDMNIYEVNIRQYTPEGTIQAFIPHISRLRDMGVDMLWIMPVQEVGAENRKGGLGSYYSIKNYTAVNQNFGSLDDFKQLVDTAHKNEMVVILDWVANHTAYDHHWTKEHKSFYNLDSAGNLQSPVEDWSDVADLNYDNKELHQAMISEMKWWLEEASIDGFRCDVAGMVPNDFWDKAIDSLEKIKPVFMLAEWDEPKMHSAGFDMTYGWAFHHLINDIAAGHKNADSLSAYLKNDLQQYPDSAFRMYFTSNHDENSWNGTVFERLGDAYKAMAVMTYTVPHSMPLVYSGQEAGLNERLNFFDKDTIDFSTFSYEDFYKNLNSLKHENSALWNGAYGGDYQELNLSEDPNIIAFKRAKAGNEVYVIANLSKLEKELNLANLNLSDLTVALKSEKLSINHEKEQINMPAWSYLVLTTDSKK